MSDLIMDNCGRCGGSVLQSGFRPVCPECLEAFGDVLVACERLIETIRIGTVYKDAEPSYYNGSIDYLFGEVASASAAIAKAKAVQS